MSVQPDPPWAAKDLEQRALTKSLGGHNVGGYNLGDLQATISACGFWILSRSGTVTDPSKATLYTQEQSAL